MQQHSSIESYIATFPPDIQTKLEQLRQIIRKSAPEAKEAISYGMPTFKLYGNLVHFAAWKTHIGFYPAPSGIAAFAKELSFYVQTKGSVHFDLDRPLPITLIKKIVAYRAAENIALYMRKQKTVKKPTS